jgi:GntR family transcriptional regulator
VNAYFLELERAISGGEFKPGEALPDAAALAARYGATQDEIRDALSELIYEGVLERRRPRPEPDIVVPVRHPWGVLGGNHSITKESKARGEEPGVEIINWQLVRAWPSICHRMDLASDEDVQIMERLRTSNGVPVGIEVSYFPAKFYPGITPELFTSEGSGQSSFAVMEKKFGLVSDRARDVVSVVCLEQREADYLKVPAGTPVLERFRVTLSDKGIPIKASRAVWLFQAAFEMGVH